MFLKNKRGVFALTLFILAIFLLGYGAFIFAVHKPTDEEKIAGREAVMLNNISNQGELVFNYISQAAEYAAFESIMELTMNAGTDIECGSNNGIAYLESRDKLCYFNRERIEENFETIFNKKLKVYLDRYNGVSFDVYKIELDDNLRVFVDSDIIISGDNLLYNTSSDFTTEIEFDFDEFVKLMEDIKTIRNDKCAGIDATKACWESELNKYSGYSFVISENNNLFIFEVIADNGLKNFFWEKEVILKFIIDNSGGFKEDA